MSKRQLESIETIWVDFCKKVLPYLTIKTEMLVQIIMREYPRIEKFIGKTILEVFEIMFSPQQLLRQLLIVTAVQLLIMAGKAIGEIGNSLVVLLSKAEREQEEVIMEMGRATSYQEWKEVAVRLDFMRWVSVYTSVYM